MLGERLDIVGPVAQRRHIEVNDVEPVEQVAAEAASVRLLREAAVGGGDYAEVQVPRPVLSQFPDFALLQRAQQLRLPARRQLPYFVEEHGSTRSLLQQAAARLPRAGECSLGVTEEFRVDQLIAEGRAVDGREALVAPRTLLVQRARHEFLAGAAFPFDQDGEGSGCRAGDCFPKGDHGEAAPHQPRHSALCLPSALPVGPGPVSTHGATATIKFRANSESPDVRRGGRERAPRRDPTVRNTIAA